MEVRAITKDIGASPRKVPAHPGRPPGTLRGPGVGPPALRPVPARARYLQDRPSAAANAENNFDLDVDDLFIKRAYADEARMMKRFRPRSRGRVSPILKRSSHITIILDQREA